MFLVHNWKYQTQKKGDKQESSVRNYKVRMGVVLMHPTNYSLCYNAKQHTAQGKAKKNSKQEKNGGGGVLRTSTAQVRRTGATKTT